MSTARDIVRALGGRWAGRQGSCRCPAHEDSSPSLSVSETRDGRALVHCFAGCSQGDVIAALRAVGLWEGSAVGDPSYPGRLTSTHDERRAAEEDRRRQAAEKIWNDGRLAPGTIVEAYLRCRGIRVPLSSEIRFHPSLKHHDAGRYLPALLGRISHGSGFCAVQRTYLRPDGSGKADVSGQKRTLGPMRDGAVRLYPAGEVLGLAEGIETALSAVQLYSVPVWACLSANRLAGIAIPAVVRSLLIFADAGNAGMRAALAAADRYELMRRIPVEVISPMADFSALAAGDYNDVVGAQ